MTEVIHEEMLLHIIRHYKRDITLDYLIRSCIDEEGQTKRGLMMRPKQDENILDILTIFLFCMPDTTLKVMTRP
jgi:hypothetical protein